MDYPPSGLDPAGSRTEPDRLRTLPPSPGSPASRGWGLSIILLLATFATTLFRGVFFEAGLRGVEIGDYPEILANPGLLALGIPYSLALLGILGTHEMGHYLACRRYGIDTTPPYFLPFPSLIGTFGAFIRIRGRITDRRALFDIGVAGPLAGFVVVIPVVVLGVMSAEWQPMEAGAGGYFIGDCLLTRLLVAFLAEPPPEPEGYVLTFGGLAMAGWVGLFATALNLLPVAQLDGGHIAYSFSNRFHEWISRCALAAFVLLGLAVNFMWLFWATLLVFFGLRHPPVADEGVGLTRGRVLVALAAALILALCFIPDPLRLIPPATAG